MMKIYAGIGSRKADNHILSLIIEIGKYFALRGYILRSGGADGCDMAFEHGCDLVHGKKEIFLPWENFNDNHSSLFKLDRQAYQMAEKYHDGWHYLSNGARKMMARNMYQVLGKDLESPVKMIICWTSDGCENGKLTTKNTGGTGQAIRVASDYEIPVINIKNSESLRQLMELVRKN